MITFTVFPRLRQNPNEKNNPYIENFIASLNREGESTVINPPHRNPLLSILPPKRWGDVIIFNWFESIPDFKYGLLQAVTAICFVTVLKLAKKKIVWVLHNKKPHNDGYTGMKKFLMRYTRYRRAGNHPAEISASQRKSSFSAPSYHQSTSPTVTCRE